MNPTCPHPEITCAVIYVTPNLAKEMIEANTLNQRNIKKTNLTKIESNFRKDVFVLNGESLIRSATKRILDGQHRLHGCVNTGHGFWTVFVDNVPDEYFPTIDSGRSRSFADVLHIRGEAYPSDLAPSAQLLGEYMKSPRSVGGGAALSNNELNDVIEMAPTLSDSVRFCKRALCGLLPTSLAAWLHWVTADAGCGEKFQEFLESLGSGAMLADDSPVYWLRKRLEANRLAKAKLPRRELVALLIKAWNAYAAGAQVRTLRWSAAENFPEPIVVRFSAAQVA